MTIHYYILPIEVGSGTRGPKYFSWRLDPDPPGITCPWSMKDYGSINQAVICADISAADHTAISAHADVLSIPTNLDTTLTTSTRNAARTFCATYNIPGGWINTSMTYRAVLRTITAFFLYFQRVTGILGHGITLPSGWLDLQFQQVSSGIQTAMVQAATDMGFSTANLQPTTTMRAILKYMADAWGSTPIMFGIATI
jgi:hypothetical protein